MKPCRLGILVSGSGTNMENIAIQIEEGDIGGEIAIVISNVAGAYALVRAKSHRLNSAFIDPCSFPDREAYDAELIRVLEENRVDLVVLAGYMLLAGHEFVNRFRYRIMNIHPALLPSFPGTSGVGDALAYGAKVTGVTVHFVDEGLDTGPVILQEAVPILEGDTEETLYPRIHEVEYRLYPQAIDHFCRGRLRIEGRRVRIVENSD
ncbi:MAG: phosphoribosylglycinamide formyltransferase [Actinobacteria bacterium RBG_19FT_COMBO_54_7]|uniref:Phosphoribosylglycinamide formyltransferase n=1 Tax=Candidatus Solincola sediminis TaxID=1797199 RepID=A0A1F2WK68_9ACTN|nr:MAG: phosphoribosylglycinamide formyltransferase [Candidatus Solincola sediminis]OFW57249.1 MAG: phosphoribosylglycinamide formyltransferase [Candidatus Solincola sediminis]OFW70311.1 MAG: phosphoribosylglycinamide formyltransferase [Actinobacteria bacterium RBG_19FT_COMBO_54_7]